MTARQVTTIAAVLSMALFTVGQSAAAQSTCLHATALQDGVFDPVTNANTGQITRGGWLNGSVLETFRTDVLPTGEATTLSFTADFTLTTAHGQLKGVNVYLLNFTTGNAAVLGHVDPTTSTGNFARATGVLYFAGKTLSLSPYVIQAEVTADVCFAK